MRQQIFAVAVMFLLAAPVHAAWGQPKPDAPQPVTVAQLGQRLAAAHGLSDGKIAEQLGSLVLTERLSRAQLARWQSALPGRHSREALTAMADLSEFLDTPVADRLSEPPPDPHAQGAIVSGAIDYVVHTLARLPDFYATRTTVHFEDMPSRPTARMTDGVEGATYYDLPSMPLHRTSQLSTRVTYLDGAEVQGARRMDADALSHPRVGLSTAGEFGPILSVVLNDAMHGSMTWAWWEQTPSGKLAVFRYSVPQAHSHYAVALIQGTDGKPFLPAYHGQIAIDPTSGAIFRITILTDGPDAETQGGAPFSAVPTQKFGQSAMAVDYGPVSLGERIYICPVHGVAVLTEMISRRDVIGLQTQINDIAFTRYHLARGDVTIVPTP